MNLALQSLSSSDVIRELFTWVSSEYDKPVQPVSHFAVGIVVFPFRWMVI